MSALIWRDNTAGRKSAVLAGLTIATVSPDGWWSSYLLGHTGPCASLDDGRAGVEAAWSDWMARAGLVWRSGE